MPSLRAVLMVVHLIGLALGVGAASGKLTLLWKCRKDDGFVPTYKAVARPLTHLIILGLALLTLSGIGWLIAGYPLTSLLVAKLFLVLVIWVLGPIIDNVVEPMFMQLAPAPAEAASEAFVRIRTKYLMVELLATGLFYVVILMWVLG
jgi:hypothetical protein